MKRTVDISVVSHVPKSMCWNCGQENDAASGPSTPNKGDVALCITCGVVSVFNEDLVLREPTIDELLEANKDEIVKIFKKTLSILHERYPDKFKMRGTDDGT